MRLPASDGHGNLYVYHNINCRFPLLHDNKYYANKLDLNKLIVIKNIYGTLESVRKLRKSGGLYLKVSPGSNCQNVPILHFNTHGNIFYYSAKI